MAIDGSHDGVEGISDDMLAIAIWWIERHKTFKHLRDPREDYHRVIDEFSALLKREQETRGTVRSQPVVDIIGMTSQSAAPHRSETELQLSTKYTRCGLNADWSSAAWWVGPRLARPDGGIGGPNRVAGDVYIIADEESDDPRFFVFRRWYAESGNPSAVGADAMESYNDTASMAARERLNEAGHIADDPDNDCCEDVDCLGSMPIDKAITIAEETVKQVITNRKAIAALEEFARQGFQLSVKHGDAIGPGLELQSMQDRVKAEIRRLMGT